MAGTTTAIATVMTEQIRQSASLLHAVPPAATEHPVDLSDSSPLSPAALKRLFAWLSPAFPVGGFSYSHGLEWAIEDGSIASADDLTAWIADILFHGAGWSDTIIFLHTHNAARTGNRGDLLEINALAIALQPSKERHLEATAQGRAFLSTVAATWPNEAMASFADLFDSAVVTYPLAVALACAAHDIPPGHGLNAYLGGFVANLVSAAVRAVPLGQTDGQRVIAALSPQIDGLISSVSTASLDMVGGSAWRADIASMKHETQYTRLFRS